MFMPPFVFCYLRGVGSAPADKELFSIVAADLQLYQKVNLLLLGGVCQ